MRAVRMREQKESERIAKLLVESLVPGATMSSLDSQAHGEHDYDLTYPNGLVVPLEVTESRDSQIEGAVGALHSGPFVTRNASRNDWYVHPLSGARINDIRTNIDQYLAAIELEGVDRFYAFRDASRFPGVRKIVEDLKIEAGTIAAWSPPGRIGIAQPSQNAMSPVDSFSAVERAVELAVSKKREKKFASRDASERHLLVYVHPRNYPVWVAPLGSRGSRTAALAAGLGRNYRCVGYGARSLPRRVCRLEMHFRAGMAESWQSHHLRLASGVHTSGALPLGGRVVGISETEQFT